MSRQSSLRYYVITSPLLDNIDEATRYGMEKDARAIAIELSRYTPWMEYTIHEMPEDKIIAIYRSGVEYIVVQRRLDGFVDEQFAAKVGKRFWVHLENQAVRIHVIKSKLNFTNIDQSACDVLEQNLAQYLNVLKIRVNRFAYLYLDWKHLKEPLTKNRKKEMPIELSQYNHSQINRRMRSGYIETGYLVIEQKWELVEEKILS